MFRIVAPPPNVGSGVQALPPMRNGVKTTPPVPDGLKQRPTALSDQEKLERRNREWQPGTSGFEDIGTPSYAQRDTFPMMVLRGIAEQQGESQPVMESEISGAANGAAIVGIGNVMGSVLNYGSNFMI